MKRWWRWTKRIVVGVMAFAILATAITIGALHTAWGRERVRRIAEEQLKAVFPGSTIGQVDGSVFGTLIVHDVTILGRDKQPFITVKTVVLAAALSPLVHKTARVESILADGVVVYVHDQGPAPAKKPEPPSGPSEPSAWSVELPAIAVTDARIEIKTPNGTEVIDKLEAGASLSLRDGTLSASAAAHATWRGEKLALDADVQQGDTLRVPYLAATLGGARVVALGASVDGTKIAGSVSAFVPAALAQKLRDVVLPGDVSLLATLSGTGALDVMADVGGGPDQRQAAKNATNAKARPSGGSDDAIAASTSGACVRVLAKTNLDTQTVHAIVAADVPDVAVLSGGAAQGRGTVVATVIAAPNRIDGMVAIAGDAQGYAGSVVVGTAFAPDAGRVVIAGSGVGWLLGGSADLARHGEAWTLDRSEIVARAYDVEPMRGEVSAAITATGPLAPAPSLDVKGTIDGRAVRYQDISIPRAHASFAAANIPAAPTGSVDVEVDGFSRGTLSIPLVTLGAKGTQHEDGTIDVDFQRHRVRTADGLVWAGSGGHVRVTEQSIAVTQIATASGPSKLTAQATIGRTSDALTAKVTARDVAVAMFDPTLTGTLAADLDVARSGGMWKGTATVDAKQIVLPKRPVLDGKLTVKIDKRRVAAVVTASNPTIGAATLDLDVIGPRDITDAAAWQRLERSSIQSVRIALSKIDASKLGASGLLDGELAISAIDAGGVVDVRGVVTDVGTIDSQLALAAAERGEIAAHGTLHLGGVDPVDVNATLALPIHPFDPTGWQSLGRETLRQATIEAKRLAFDPELAKRFGITSPWRGWASTKITIGPAARTSEFALDVHDLRDGPLTKPVELHVTGGSDASGVHADAKVSTDKVALTLAAKSPLSVEAMLAGNAKAAPIEATLTVPPTAARELGLLVGRQDVLAGTVGGTVTVVGTIESPTARAQLAVDNLSVAAGIASKPPTLEKLTLDARWLGVKTGFELELTGFETGGRLLKISARGQPSQPEGIVATIEAGNFDIAPFLAFAPPGSQATGIRGLVSGVLKLKGVDPSSGDIKGRLVISEARVPLAAELGTLRSATVEIDVIKKEVHATIAGKLGRGKVDGKVVMRMTGSMPTSAEVTLALRKISPIGEIQPVIDADISGWFAQTKTKWAGKLTVKHGNIYVPPETGNELLGVGAPGDIVFIDAAPVLARPKRKPPTAPWLVADIDLEPMKILVDDENFRFQGTASGQLQLKYGGGGIGLDGSISTDRSAVDVLGRNYRLDHGIVEFDGTLDPRLDIEMTHDFRSLTLTVDILGRSSTPDLRLSADSGSYSQGQLLSFLAGGTPSDDPASQSSDALASGGLAAVSSRLGRRINKHIPFIKFDTINYEAQTATSSRALRFGKNINDKTHLEFRQRFEPRVDENAHEGVLTRDLPHDWLLEATGGEKGAGADLLWRKRW
jgi:hypothetical protein